MKVAHLIDSGGLYGAEQVLLTLCKEQQQQGLHPIIVSCGLPGEALKPLEHAANDQHIDLIVWRMPAGLNRAGTLLLLNELNSRGVQLLNSHGYKFNILLGMLGKSKIGLPLVSTVHGYVKAKFPKKMWVYEFLDRIFLKRFDAIVLVSEKMREIPAFRNSKKVHVIKNGINSKEASLPSTLEGNPYQLLAIGRLSPEKGFDYLIKAVAEINKTETICQLTIYGEGSLRNSLAELISSLSQQNNIKLAGFIANAQQHFHRYQLIVMPSLTEGIPVTLLEAMRNKTPIIASAVGGIPEVLGVDSYGLLTPASTDSIVNKLRQWFSLSNEEKEAYVENNYQKYFLNFSAQGMGLHYLSLYSALKGAHK
ncbi:glycosyltransferase [Cellvibrio sp. QJXJ]|nr:glycosyltransferase [Cellvibrio sp. QJXJ]